MATKPKEDPRPFLTAGDQWASKVVPCPLDCGVAVGQGQIACHIGMDCAMANRQIVCRECFMPYRRFTLHTC
jgi:hypothetical protein